MLQHERTGRYVAEGGSWADDPNRALTFGGLEKVGHYGAGQSFRDLRIIALAGRVLALGQRVLKKEVA